MGSSLAWVPTSGRLYLYGGWDGAVFFNAIWSFDPAAGAWTDREPSGAAPSARAMQAMAYVPASPTTKESLIVFGGYDGSGYLGDTWIYDLAEDAWTNLAPAGASPAARDGHALVYDPASGRVILFGGWDGTTQFGDTWAYDPAANAWTELTPAGDSPAARDSHAMVYDPATARVVLFGGWSQTAEFNDTWLYDPAANTWTKATPAEGSPSARALAQMVCDSKGERIVLFGGGTAGNVAEGDTWIYNPVAGTWNQVAPGGEQPMARTGHAMAYDPATGTAYLFGGSDGSVFFNDVWTYVR
jgi:N-acetylneuraminic acid mutarotase